MQIASDAPAVQAAELRFRAVARAAPQLVGTVAAVVVVVAVPPAWYALVVMALEVGWVARVELGLAARRRLVLAVHAVRVAVALPRHRNASATTIITNVKAL